MAGSTPINSAQNIIVLLAMVGFAVWIGMILQAEREDKLEVACAPIEFSTDGLHGMATGLVGYPPNWTLTLQEYLMGGCYYFFSTVLLGDSGEDEDVTGATRSRGAIHR